MEIMSIAMSLLVLLQGFVGEKNSIIHIKATIGVEFQTQKRFRVVTSAYCRGAGRALIVHDITRTTFDSVGRWLDELNIHSDTTIARMLVGNKSDLGNVRDVSVEEGKSLAEGLFFMETPVLDSTNVRTAFEMVIKEIYNNVSRKVLNSDAYKAELSTKSVSLIDEKSKQTQDDFQFPHRCLRLLN
ncbi:hypothetical protein MKX03_020271 [Papaver bracteatum]|nr:hypothetical protein MKX03_020271 [Papaver bracteatum]